MSCGYVEGAAFVLKINNTQHVAELLHKPTGIRLMWAGAGLCRIRRFLKGLAREKPKAGFDDALAALWTEDGREPPQSIGLGGNMQPQSNERGRHERPVYGGVAADGDIDWDQDAIRRAVRSSSTDPHDDPRYGTGE